MPRKQQKPKPKPFEALKSRDVFAQIYDSMLLSEAWAKLSDRQKVLYLCCKAQFYGKRKPCKDYPNDERFQSEQCFYFSRKDIIRYGIFSESNSGRGYKELKKLEEYGFIDILSSGKVNKTKSIYKFSDRWKTFKKTKT